MTAYGSGLVYFGLSTYSSLVLSQWDVTGPKHLAKVVSGELLGPTELM